MQLPSLLHFRGSAPAESQMQAAGQSGTGSKKPIILKFQHIHPPLAFLPPFSPALWFLLPPPTFQPQLLQHPPSHKVTPCSGVDFLTHSQLKLCLGLTSALVSRIRGQGVPKEAVFAAVTVEACSVVDALEAFSRLAIAVPHGVGLHVAIALAWLTGPGSCWVSKIAISTVLTVGPWERRDEEKLMHLPGRQRLPCFFCFTEMGVVQPSEVWHNRLSTLLTAEANAQHTSQALKS